MDNKGNTYKQSTDFYWKAIVFYFVALLAYSFIFGSVVEGKITIKIFNPVVMLLSIIIIISFISMAFRFMKKKAVVVGKDYIIFKTRNTEKKVNASEISAIKFSSQMRFKTKNRIDIVRIKITSHKKPVNIRISSFDHPELLLKDLELLKKTIKHA